MLVLKVGSARANRRKKILVIVGPTASGKSDLAVRLAKKYNGEIVSADSRQVYKGLNIGSGKITKKEMRGVPHHMLDVVLPKRRFTVAQYQKKATKIIQDILKRGKLPIIAGGAGFYIQAVVDNFDIPPALPDLALRKNLEKRTTQQLFKQLQKLDPRRTREIDRHNKRRLVRAIEITLALGRVPKLKKQQRFDALFLGISVLPSTLRKNIENRLRERLKRGMIAEVKKLLNPPASRGFSWRRMEEFGLTYRSVARFLQGKISKEEMVEQIKTEELQYAKRQLTWFRRDKRIYWIRSRAEVEKLVATFIK